jgi:hypothetical protein
MSVVCPTLQCASTIISNKGSDLVETFKFFGKEKAYKSPISGLTNYKVNIVNARHGFSLQDYPVKVKTTLS